MPVQLPDVHPADLTEKLSSFQKKGKAILATNFYNYETLRGILQAAAVLEQPIILQLTKSSLDYMGLASAVKMARAGLQSFNIKGWLHLDHCYSYSLIQQCLDAGFDSVMIDASERPLEDNIRITRKVVDLALQYNANVEAELGYVAKLGQSTDQVGFTDPEEARQFVEATGVHALAVAIGSAHGFYKQEPRLDIELLATIREKTGIPLVLHGGSGIPAAALQQAIKNGISKINLATEIKNIFIQTLQACLTENEEIDLRVVFPPAINAVSDLVKEKLAIINQP
ncbi:class II fructose-bisphosphate aldolase [Flavihumibacter sp. CACIAM 22H1]|uniref:class II fructose-bisphosphate aldolase n=1 Tax=Flavihumibacter sp. CACIAM 22H1 TaxID=1812911 RepID=UPI0007A850EE|nr:class II fructose-bisphosphate aldolase [Flavihumibacter sp. CACIAM 22H1]KYP14405.1 MAG: ketose-bisphosphate aldolase [Flavihumibacter sp. CACIAM 22H1]